MNNNACHGLWRWGWIVAAGDYKRVDAVVLVD